ncbi:putative serine/threonine-protein kinase pim-3-like [Triplophysa rosa]|uniref:non-specific serine/threonine protein kinase n=1 Tax=Triplophysa rosa TaxID=992332 RepID=A0A9W7WXQ6_TRIRA|nr:putative serine/threonine-protein kinase pim-3-like [Triplophysa rosa]
MRSITVVSSANFRSLSEGSVEVQSLVYREKSSGESTHPWGAPVAIKFLSKYEDDSHLVIPGHFKPLLTEVALMLMMRRDPVSRCVIKMLEWFEDPYNITIIIEYPHPSKTLEDYILDQEILIESMACHLMVQAVQALQDCIEHGVFHTDIHPANILINTNTLDLKLIDFSCGQLFTTAGYQKNDYRGAPSYCPPEILSKPTFHAIPANVWHLGLILYEMVNGCLPFTDSAEILFKNPYVSRECRSVVEMCLARDPAERPTLEQILQHRWFSGARSSRCEFSSVCRSSVLLILQLLQPITCNCLLSDSSMQIPHSVYSDRWRGYPKVEIIHGEDYGETHTHSESVLTIDPPEVFTVTATLMTNARARIIVGT